MIETYQFDNVLITMVLFWLYVKQIELNKMIKKKTERKENRAFTAKRSHCYKAIQIKRNKANKKNLLRVLQRSKLSPDELRSQMNNTQLKERIILLVW